MKLLFQVEVDAGAVAAQPRLAHGLVAAALEMLGEPQNHGAAGDELSALIAGG